MFFTTQVHAKTLIFFNKKLGSPREPFYIYGNQIKVMEYKSLYQYLGRAAGSELGSKVMDKAIKHEIKYRKQEVDPKLVPSGFVYSYPVYFLDNFFKRSDIEKKFQSLERRLELLENKVFGEDKLLGEGIAFPTTKEAPVDNDELPF